MHDPTWTLDTACVGEREAKWGNLINQSVSMEYSSCRPLHCCEIDSIYAYIFAYELRPKTVILCAI